MMRDIILQACHHDQRHSLTEPHLMVHETSLPYAPRIEMGLGNRENRRGSAEGFANAGAGPISAAKGGQGAAWRCIRTVKTQPCGTRTDRLRTAES